MQTEQDLRALFDNSRCIDKVTIIHAGNEQKLTALVDMDINFESAEAIRRRYNHRWWHERVINVDVSLYH